MPELQITLPYHRHYLASAAQRLPAHALQSQCPQYTRHRIVRIVMSYVEMHSLCAGSRYPSQFFKYRRMPFICLTHIYMHTL